MDLTTPLLTGALFAVFTGIQVWINKGRFDRIERELASLRSDLLQVALAATGRRETG